MYLCSKCHESVQVQRHSTFSHKLCHFAIVGGPKVYDVSKYLDDHPGGSEVILDVAGQNADEFFEDIGHSKDAREELKKHLIGTFKLDEATLAKMKADAEKKSQQSSQSTLILGAAVGLIAIYVAFTQMR